MFKSLYLASQRVNYGQRWICLHQWSPVRPCDDFPDMLLNLWASLTCLSCVTHVLLVRRMFCARLLFMGVRGRWQGEFDVHVPYVAGVSRANRSAGLRYAAVATPS